MIIQDIDERIPKGDIKLQGNHENRFYGTQYRRDPTEYTTESP
jgi:hypothetical protein